jgi:hypothetical protein
MGVSLGLARGSASALDFSPEQGGNVRMSFQCRINFAMITKACLHLGQAEVAEGGEAVGEVVPDS